MDRGPGMARCPHVGSLGFVADRDVGLDTQDVQLAPASLMRS